MAIAIGQINATDAIRGDIGFLRPTVRRPFTYNYEAGADAPAETVAFDVHSVEIRNVRRAPRALSLDTEGVELLAHRSCVADFDDDEAVTRVYYAEAEALIKDTTGAREVVVFDHNIRRGLALPLAGGRRNLGRPVMHAHTDYTAVSALRRLSDHFGADAERLARRRFLQVNLWRPIRGPLRDSPLAICDASSIGANGLETVDLIYPSRRGEIYYLGYEPTQRWYYAPDMQPDEAWLFKNFDSDAESPARFAAHSAFDERGAPAPVRPRESIEVRAFAFLDS